MRAKPMAEVVLVEVTLRLRRGTVVQEVAATPDPWLVALVAEKMRRDLAQAPESADLGRRRAAGEVGRIVAAASAQLAALAAPTPGGLVVPGL